MSNSAYAHTPGAGVTGYVNNGRNQVTSVGGSAVGYDARFNITSAPGVGSYGYDAANRLTTANGAALTYDLAGRLATVGGSTTSRFVYDGHQVIGELDGAGALVRRYIPGAGLDDVVAAYEGPGFDRRWHYADERGSVIGLADNSGASTGLNTYDEYGVPGAGNIGLLQYTGQMWLPQAQLHHYRARAYAPQLGRFMQTDPIGYGDGANLYAYVGGDPVNWVDPFGLDKRPRVTKEECEKIGGTWDTRYNGENVCAIDSVVHWPRAAWQSSVTGGRTGIMESRVQCRTFGFIRAEGGFAVTGFFLGTGYNISLTAGQQENALGGGSKWFGTFQMTELKGFGFFLGGGVVGGLGYSDAALPQGESESISNYIEAGGGWGGAASGSLSWNDGGASSFGSGRIGAGWGGYAGGTDSARTTTWALRPTDCSERQRE